ncbi:MAG TPA: hypothetical protein PK887_04985 [Ignavibacteriales bacterium]|nr:hypothetical protein [Ignavibacteriales bacterium]
MKKVAFFMFLVVFLAFSQEQSLVSFNYGADVVSRYIWRGMEFGENTPHIQPWGGFTFNLGKAGQIDFGFWASYGLSSEGSKYSENDLNFKYSYNADFGTIALTLNDYYYPYLSNFSNFKKDGNGGHTAEAGLVFDGSENFPIHILVSTNFYNQALLANGDKENALYAEVGYKFKLNDVELSPIVGVAQGESIWHQVTTDKFEVINVGITASKEIKISNEFSLPTAVSWIWNPHLKKTYTVFKISL